MDESDLYVKAQNAVLKNSVSLDAPIVKGYDWNNGVDYRALLENFSNCGLQATNLATAIAEVNKMIKIREEPYYQEPYYGDDEFVQTKNNLTIFLGYTSNMVSSGNRESIRFLVENKMVDCLVTTAGGVEEDFIKCLSPTLVGEFNPDDRNLRERGINRAGNLYIPNNNYCEFETWVTPILDAILEEQKSKGVLWTPSKLIERLGKEINNVESIYYWAAVNKIPVFCPALTDGSLGDMMYFHSFNNPGLVIDILSDLKRLNTMAVRAKNTGMIILGGGVVKHHICNANLMRNGADFAIYINTGVEYDGSDSGARPEEAISWGKIRGDSNPVKVYGDASILFPLLVGETFARHFFAKRKKD